MKNLELYKNSSCCQNHKNKKLNEFYDGKEMDSKDSHRDLEL